MVIQYIPRLKTALYLEADWLSDVNNAQKTRSDGRGKYKEGGRGIPQPSLCVHEQRSLSTGGPLSLCWEIKSEACRAT